MHDAEFRAMVAADERHWWYRGRRRVVRAVLDGLDLPQDALVLDAGCGSGRMLDELVDYGAVTGVDLNPAAVATARGRGHEEVHLAGVEATYLPDEEFHLVTALDVIEHTRDDVRTLRELRRVARPGAAAVVTVPAYQALWSAHDEANQHFRRYTAPRLRRAAALAGWVVERDTYFNSLLLPPAAAVRLLRRGRAASTSDLSATPQALNALFELPLRAEASLLRHGGRLPAGLSLLAVLRNPAMTAAAAERRLVRVA
jgi:SAM-dependent methyltransferase